MQQPSLTKYAMYVKEQFNHELIEVEHGFITYEIISNLVCIKDLWVHPMYRKFGIGRKLADNVVEIGKEKKCEWVAAEVLKTANNWQETLIANKCFGLKEIDQDEFKIYLTKEI